MSPDSTMELPSEPRVGLDTDDRRLIIVGAGGFGREVWLWLQGVPGHPADRVVGYLDRDLTRLDGHAIPRPILGDPADYRPRQDDCLLLAIGIPRIRRDVASGLMARGGRFATLVHPSAIVAPTARIAAGCIIGPMAIVSDAVILGAFTLVNYHASLGHDAATGDYCVLSPNATLGGGARIDDDVFLGLSASVGPAMKVGARSKIAANSAALGDIPTDSLVVGVPGRVSPLLAEPRPEGPVR